MPTLFTALQAHAAKPKRRNVPRPAVTPSGGLFAEISGAGGLRAPVKAARRIRCTGDGASPVPCRSTDAGNLTP
jgi:hypothetical protein